MEKCRRMKRPQCMSKNWIYSWLWKSSTTHHQYYRSESFAMKTDILMNGSTVKKNISLKTGFGYNATRRTSFRSWFQACQRVVPPVLILQPQWHLQDRRVIILHLPQARLLHQLRQYQATVRFETEDQSGIDSPPVPVSSSNVEEMIERINPLFAADSGMRPQANPKSKNKCRGNHGRTGKPVVCRLRSSAVVFWNLGVAARIQRKSFSDERVPEHRDSHASSSHGVSSEPTSKRSVDLGKHSAYTHFPKDRNCEICQRTKITRAPCRRRNGGAVLRAENFGDLITAYHKVLSENCESRNNHRYAVVVRDLATRWIQSYPCETKTS